MHLTFSSFFVLLKLSQFLERPVLNLKADLFMFLQHPLVFKFFDCQQFIFYILVFIWVLVTADNVVHTHLNRFTAICAIIPINIFLHFHLYQPQNAFLLLVFDLSFSLFREEPRFQSSFNNLFVLRHFFKEHLKSELLVILFMLVFR